MSADISNHLPLRYEDTPDYCEVYDKNGEKVALTMRPDLLRALERSSERRDEGDIGNISLATFSDAVARCAAAEAELAYTLSMLNRVLFESAWRPIETAPRDGSRILLCWNDSPTLSPHVELGKRKDFTWANTYGRPFSGEPTHWMALPEPGPYRSPVSGSTEADNG